jgi:heme exporter protein D
MMNHADVWMGGWAGGGMWVWTVIGIVVVALLVLAIGKFSKKQLCVPAPAFAVNP